MSNIWYKGLRRWSGFCNIFLFCFPQDILQFVDRTKALALVPFTFTITFGVHPTSLIQRI